MILHFIYWKVRRNRFMLTSVVHERGQNHRYIFIGDCPSYITATINVDEN